MTMRRKIGAILTAALCLTAPLSAVAQDEDPVLEHARARFEQGTQHYEAGRYGLAAEEFRFAFDEMTRVGHPRALMVLYNLGRALEQIPGHEQEARAAYQRILDEALQTPEFENTRSMASDGLRELDARGVGPSTSGSSTPSPIGPVLLGGGGAVLVAGIIVGAITLVEDDGLTAMCTNDVCPESARELASTVETLALTADILTIAGGVITAAGLALTIFLQEEEEESPTATVGGACVPGACGVSVRGVF